MLLVSLPVAQAQTVQTEINEVQASRQMTASEQDNLMHMTEIGLKWITGQMSFDDVVRSLGEPAYHSRQSDVVKYAYYPGGVMAVYFIYNKLYPVDGKPGIDNFAIKVDDNVHTNIPYEQLDRLGLHRVVRGERIDGVRSESADFFFPTGVAQVYGIHPRNYVTFSYRLPLPPDSPFDIYMGAGYLGEWVSENGRPTLDNLRKATDLRGLSIGRHYLTPEELKQRDDAKRRKYGDMHLCTGMTCPESGIWEPWTSNGPTEAYYLEQGRTFPEAADITMDEAKRRQRYPKMEPARWMWVRRDSWFERS